MKLFEPGRDVHAEVAERVFGAKAMRPQAKIIGHGLNYGLGVDGMVRNGVKRELAEQFVREMKTNFPRLDEWKMEVRGELSPVSYWTTGSIGRCELTPSGHGRKLPH
jgi:DNA polymerase I-like protein with 3'-5' exonuclease and polymerase domains